MARTAADWVRILTELGVKPGTAVKWSDVFAQVIQPGVFSHGDGELDEFLGQVLHESGMLEHLEEGLYYSTPERICAVWPRRFPTVADARPYAKNPEALANKVYGGRMGNVKPGDGWRNRGSGLIQITGAENLRAVQAATGVPVYDHPELLRAPTADCLRVCIAWWEKNIPDAITDDDDVTAETKRVNGGTVGLADRQHLTNEAREAL
jgi:putative chitinase